MAKHGYENVSIDEIRNKLRNEHNIVSPDILKQNKTQLVQILKEHEDNSVKDILDNVEEEEEEQDAGEIKGGEDDKVDTPEPEVEIMPAFGTKQWPEYVMRQFHEDELIDGNPTCDGCRRVVEQLIGPITQSHVHSYVAPNKENHGTAVVVFAIDVFVTLDSHPAFHREIAYSDIADVNRYNTDEPYSKYSTATASTRAEGRVLRKILKLKNVATAEEVSERAENDEEIIWEADEDITNNQISVIDMLCSRHDIDVMGLINSGRKTYPAIEAVPKKVAQTMIQFLGDVQRGAKKRPKNVGSYNPNWRK